MTGKERVKETVGVETEGGGEGRWEDREVLGFQRVNEEQ